MDPDSSFYQWQGRALVLQLLVQPKARKDEIVGPHGDALKIRITAPPVDGKANRHLLKMVAKTFGVKERAITLLSGESSRHKRLSIESPTLLPPLIAPKPNSH